MEPSIQRLRETDLPLAVTCSDIQQEWEEAVKHVEAWQSQLKSSVPVELQD